MWNNATLLIVSCPNHPALICRVISSHHLWHTDTCSHSVKHMPTKSDTNHPVFISGFKYSVGYALRLDDEEFVVISQIVANDLSEAVLLVSDLVIEEFVPKLYSYSVTKARTPATRWILVKDLKHKHPLYVYTLSRSDTMYIQPRYFSQVEYVGIV